MLEVKKIKEKVELEDLKVQADPCRYYWDDHGLKGRYDCYVDCYNKTSPYASDCY